MRRTNRLTKATAVAAALAAAASVALVTSSAAALPAGTAPNTGQTLTVAAGATSSTNYQLTLAAGSNTCPGDGIAGFKWSTYMVPASVDAATLTYTSTGPNAGTGVFAQPLFSSTASPQINKSPGLGDGLISGIPANYQFAAIAELPVPNGEYKVGYACHKDGATERYWQTNIVVSGSTATSFNWVKGTLPTFTGPTPLTVGGVDNAKITGISFTAATGDPAVTGYTVTAVPQGGGTTVGPKAATPGAAFELNSADGVVNGKQYNVTITATNANGTKNSNTVLTSVVAPPPPNAPVVTTVSASNKVTVNWTNTVPTGATLSGFTLACSTSSTFASGNDCTALGLTSTPLPLGPTVLTKAFDPAPVGNYYFKVTADYAEPYLDVTSNAVLGQSLAQVTFQTITAIRPVGALVLTQKCDVRGSAPAFNDALWMGALPAIDATTNADPTGGTRNSTGQQTAGFYAQGGLPTGSVPAGAPNDGKPADANGPAYDGYPYPVFNAGDSGQPGFALGKPNPVYTKELTNCDIDLGTARLITSGPAAGQYFATTGRINQLTVVNTQDTDGGWTLSGKVSNFTTAGGPGGTDSFSGNLLGWNPEVTFSSLKNLDDYWMKVNAGENVDPKATNSSAGLGEDNGSPLNGKTLASSPVSFSLGMAVVDARLRLLIPVTANQGTYTGTLTFTAV